MTPGHTSRETVLPESSIFSSKSWCFLGLVHLTPVVRAPEGEVLFKCVFGACRIRIFEDGALDLHVQQATPVLVHWHLTATAL